MNSHKSLTSLSKLITAQTNSHGSLIFKRNLSPHTVRGKHKKEYERKKTQKGRIDIPIRPLFLCIVARSKSRIGL
ncbi:hypothetical protein VCRA2121O337_450015 [Vibrio crassostreae]|nr:hypothetical protein VCRA2121O337_450015 [Vibrio crassostreae]